MEIPFALPTHDGKRVMGNIRTGKGTPRWSNTGRKRKSAVIFVHGITGNSSQHFIYNGARFFEQKGIDAIRFDLYPGGAWGRLLRDCTITTHVSDVNLVLDHFQLKYKKIFLVGHSLGAVTVLRANTECVTALGLWAPAGSELLKDKKGSILELIKGTEIYRIGWAADALMGSKMTAEMYSFPHSEKAALMIKKPVIVACGTDDVFLNAAKNYYTHAPITPKAWAVIPQGNHEFTFDDTAGLLHQKTWDFFRKFL